MAKEDLYREAAALGLDLEGREPELTNREIQAEIDAALTGEQQELVEVAAPEEVVEAVVEEAAPVPPEPTFALAQLKPYADQLFGVGYHVLVGAVSAGCIPAGGSATRDEWRAGIDQYLKMPVETKEDD